MRYRAAAGVGEEAHSRQPHWCPWSKPVNVETWGHVSGPIVMAHALAELRCGIVARQHENGFKSGRNFQPHPLRIAIRSSGSVNPPVEGCSLLSTGLSTEGVMPKLRYLSGSDAEAFVI